MLRQENLQLRQQVDEQTDNLVTLTKVNKQALEPIFEDEQLDRDNRLEQKSPQVLDKKQMAKLMGVSDRTVDKRIATAKKKSAPPVIEFEGKKWEYVRDSNRKVFKLLKERVE
ncbi:MAG: hypothetical protein QNJ34_15890 [Xenococcaceae cyanobacterium MO_188.B29]|nr:hypothetical protein [Xenococcaceae cyanobacterium MO_188.B29]